MSKVKSVGVLDGPADARGLVIKSKKKQPRDSQTDDVMTSQLLNMHNFFFVCFIPIFLVCFLFYLKK